jgi:hypothetical protein
MTSCFASWGDIGLEGFMTAIGLSPHFSFLTPMTATSETHGSSDMAASRMLDGIHSPPLFIRP